MANEIKFSVNLDSKQANTALKGLNEATQGIQKSLTKVEKQTSTASKAIGSFIGNFAAMGVSKLLGAATSAASGFFDTVITGSIDAAKTIENLSTTFETLLGSADAAGAILEDLQDFAASTPFQLEGIAKAAQQLLAFDIPADQVKTKLQEIGDVAAGTGQSLNEISFIFGKITAIGKLTGETLEQLQQRSINLEPAVQKILKTTRSIRELTSAGEVTADVFQKAFSLLNKEGGKFAGGMIRQSKTLSGVLSTLADNIFAVQADIGKELLPMIKSAATAMIDWIQANRDLIKANVKEFVSALIPVMKSVAKYAGEAAQWVTRFMQALNPDQAMITELTRQIEVLNNAISDDAYKKQVPILEKYRDELIAKRKELGYTERAEVKFIANLKKSNQGTQSLTSSISKSTSKLQEFKKSVTAAFGKNVEERVKSLGSAIQTAFGTVTQDVTGVNDDLKNTLAEIDTDLNVRLQAINTEFETGAKTVAEAEADRQNALDEAQAKRIKAERDAEISKQKLIETQTTNIVKGTVGAVANYFYKGLGDALGPVFDLLLNSSEEAIDETVRGVAESMPIIIERLMDNLPALSRALTETLPEALADNMDVILLSMLKGVARLVYEAIRLLVYGLGKSVNDLIMKFTNVLRDIQQAISGKVIGKKITQDMRDAIEGFGDKMVEEAKRIADAIIDAATDVAKGSVGLGGGGTSSIVKGVFSRGLSRIGFATGGKVPEGYPGDSFPASLSSGEFVVNNSLTPRLEKFLSSNDTGTTNNLLAQILEATRQSSNNTQGGNDRGTKLSTAILDLNRRSQRLGI